MKISNFPCFKCHLPQAVTHAEDSVAVELAEALIAKDSGKSRKLQITCMVCHNEKAIIHKRELGAPEKGVIYGKKDVAGHAGGKIVKSAILKDPSSVVSVTPCPNLEFDQAFSAQTFMGAICITTFPVAVPRRARLSHAKGDHLIAPNFNDDKQTSELMPSTHP